MTATALAKPAQRADVLVDRIRLDMATQSRDHINPDVANGYGELMAAGEWDHGRSTAAIVLFFDGSAYWIGDGFHRVIGARNHGIDRLPCEVREGTARDALWYSFSANALHGYRREPSDVRHILRRIAEDPEWSKKGVREIAAHTGIPKSTVQDNLKRHLSGSGQILSEVREVERNGKSYEMVVGGIGKAAGPAPERRDPPVQPGEEWYQTDIEDFTGKPQQRCNPAHASPAGRIAWLLTELRVGMTLTPTQFLAATAWSLEDELRPAVRGVLPWLHELEVLINDRR
jgi:hypothetical protein